MKIEVQQGWLGRQVSRRYKLRKRAKNVTTVVEEIYLRDDICCGSAACRVCVQESPPLPAGRSHYLIPDAETLLKFLEIWELPQISCVIYLASVIKEVLAHCNQRTHRRLRALFTDRRRQSLYFDDEHYIFTWSLVHDQETNNDVRPTRNRVEAVAAWFYDHWEGFVPVVVLRTSSDVALAVDEDNTLINQLKHLYLSDSSVNENKIFKVLDVNTYIKTFWCHDPSVSELYNSLSLATSSETEDARRKSQQNSSYDKKSTKGTPLYKEHLAGNRLEADIATGVLRAGVFSVDRQRPLEGYVQSSMSGETSKQKISVIGRMNQNRALPGDVVAVRLFGFGAKKGLVQKETSAASGDPLDSKVEDLVGVDEESIPMSDITGDAEAARKDDVEAVPFGEVVGILQRTQRDYVACLTEEDEGALKQASSNRKERVLCIPMDRRVPMVGVVTRLADRLVGQRFVIRIDGWDQNSISPRGHFVRLLGPIGDLRTEDMSLLVENGINTSPFSSASMAELPEDSEDHRWSIPSAELANRRDLRLLHRAYSIDPPGSKDVDDALSVRRVSDSIMEIGVHIADVSYFVQQNSLLDLEARARGTTVYMVGKSWQMLPSLLSENLCSLVAGKDRLAVSAIWTVDVNRVLEIVDVWFGRTIIRSRHQMFYAQAQAILDGQTLPPGWTLPGGRQEEADVASDLLILATFAQIRKDRRKADGALELKSSELRFETAANKEPVSMDTKLELPMNWIVAELMILANAYVATKIYRALPSRALLRMHGPPRLDHFSLLLECCAARGFTVDTSSNKSLANSLDRMRVSNDPLVENAFRALATRAMSEATYCSTAEVTDPSGFHHYGLALQFYTHFTSPIRRYSDVLVHRMLLAACEGNHGLENPGSEELSRNLTDSAPSGIELAEIAQHLNERHRASKVAQKECNELYMLMYLQNHAQIQQAVVIAIHEKGMVVFVPNFDIRAPVYLQDRNGHAIIPAVSDTVSKSEDSLSTMDSVVLAKTAGTIGLRDRSTGGVLHEYKLMDTVWVQLRADGSRAHAPKLNVRLLSPSHPAAKESMSSRKVGGFQNGYGPLKTEANLWSGLASRSSNVKNNKTINDMAQTLAAGQSVIQISALPIGKGSLKRKEFTINDVVDSFKRLKASSIYMDFIDHCAKLTETQRTGKGRQHHGGMGIIEAPDQAENDGNERQACSTLTMGIRLFSAVLPPQQELLQHLRRLWEKKLSHAAKIRAVRLWSTSPECGRQLQRKDKEAYLRGEANRLGTCLV